MSSAFFVLLLRWLEGHFHRPVNRGSSRTYNLWHSRKVLIGSFIITIQLLYDDLIASKRQRLIALNLSKR